MKKLLLLVFVCVFSFSVISCGKADTENNGGESMEVKETLAETVDQTVAETKDENGSDVVTQPEEEGISHVFEMTDLRKAIVDYMRSMSAVVWTPNEDFSLNGDHNTWGVNLNFKKGQTYYGLPYTRAFSGLEDFSKYIENGVYKGPCGSYDTMPGNNCSSSCDQSWRRYIVSNTEATYTYVPGFGNKTIAPVGDYEYPTGNRDTYKIISQNAQEKIFEAYALCKPADAIVKWSDAKSAGHARMIAAEAVVVRNAQGKINAGRSHLIVIEQTNKLTTVNGNQSTWLVDKVYTFSELLADGYVPVTPTVLAEGGELKVKLIDGNTSENIGKMLAGTIETNCSISSLEMVVSDENGNKVKEYVLEVENGTDKINLRKYSFNLDTASLPSGKYNYKLTVHTPALGSVTLQELAFEK